MNTIRLAQDVLKEEAEALLTASSLLGLSFEQAIELILACQGKVIVTGVGKSGLVGRKIASTLSSLGTSSVFIHPTEAFHGDLGVVGPQDVCIAISNSGKTEELMKLLPSLRLLGVKIIALCGNSDNDLAREADVLIETGVRKEACSLNLAPTTSTTVSMALGDAMAVALVKAKGFTESDFAFFHPGGTLGRKLLTRISDVLIAPEKIGRAAAGDGVKVLAEQMNISNLGLVVILDEKNKVQGIVTDGDLRRALQEPDFMNLTASAMMTTNPKAILKTRLVTEAVRLAEKHRITALIVAGDGGEFEGVVNLHDLIHEKVL